MRRCVACLRLYFCRSGGVNNCLSAFRATIQGPAATAPPTAAAASETVEEGVSLPAPVSTEGKGAAAEAGAASGRVVPAVGVVSRGAALDSEVSYRVCVPLVSRVIICVTQQMPKEVMNRRWPV